MIFGAIGFSTFLLTLYLIESTVRPKIAVALWLVLLLYAVVSIVLQPAPSEMRLTDTVISLFGLGVSVLGGGTIATFAFAVFARAELADNLPDR